MIEKKAQQVSLKTVLGGSRAGWDMIVNLDLLN
jgi:hypothetical protein